MSLIKNPDILYEEYESLLLERDQLRKEAGQIWISYIKLFGQLISEVYKEKIECIKCKKAINYYQCQLNHGDLVDTDAMQEYLEKEMAPYYQNLNQKIEEYKNCKDLKGAGEYVVRRSKILYRRLAKLIHPDINPETDRRDDLKELWQRIVTAYNFNDIKELTELEILIRKAINQPNSGDKKIQIPDIKDRIIALHEEINDIVNNEPYNYKSLIEDGQAIEEKKAALQEELDLYKKYHDELDAVISQILGEGGIKLQWLMN